MTLEEFKVEIATGDPQSLAAKHIAQRTVHAMPDEKAYDDFKLRVRELVAECEQVYIVGSGNWGYSLNPRKFWNPFHSGSDIDVAIISPQQYQSTWLALRSVHRDSWHLLDGKTRIRLRRNGEDVYCGFASPAWIPIRRHPMVFEFKRTLNKLQSPETGYRKVTMMYFKNETELVDYYRRGFRKARAELRS